MSNKIMLHQVNGQTNTNDIMEDFFPEFSNPIKKPSLLAAIQTLNSHHGNIIGSSIQPNSWILLPDYNSAVYNYIVDQNSPSPGVCSAMATIPIHGIPHVKNIGASALHAGMKTLGAKKMLAMSELIHDWFYESKESIIESPIKDSITETTKHILEKSSEHGAEIFMATRSLDQALKKFASASGKQATQAAKQEVLVASKKLSHTLPNTIKKGIERLANSNFSSQSSRRGLKAISSPGNAMRSARKLAHSETLVITGAQYTKMIKVMKYGNLVGKGIIAIDIATNTAEVVDAYEKGNNWKELAFEDSAGMAGSYAGGLIGDWLGGLSSFVCGPCVVVTAPVLSIAGTIAGEKIGKSFAKVVYKFDHKE